MISDLEPYLAMRDSGLPWCPQVPSHWELKPNRVFLRQRKMLVGDRHPDYTLLSLTKRGVIVRDLSENKGKFSSDMGTSQEVQTGDLVMCLFDVPETPRTVGLSPHHGMITGAYTVFDVCDSQVARWLEKFYIAMDDQKALSPLYSGLRNTIPKQRLLATKTPIPPPEELAAIVRYLDHVDRRVRRLVRVKRRLIALLTEQKQAIVHRAVTRGLNPDVPLKDSGVDWLGTVPEHWEVRRLGDSVLGCFNGVWGSDPNGGDDLPCVRVADFERRSRRVRRPIPTIRAIAQNSRRRRMLESGDLLLEKSGGGEQQPVGVVILFDQRGPAVCSNFIARMPVRDGFDSEFLTFLHSALYSIRLNTKSIKQTTGIQNLDSAAYLSEAVAFPPISEQSAIAVRLGRATAEIEGVVARAAREIELLNEYRTRLVGDVVTGKLDVREVAAELPGSDPGDADDNLDESPGADAEAELGFLDAIRGEVNA